MKKTAEEVLELAERRDCRTITGHTYLENEDVIEILLNLLERIQELEKIYEIKEHN